MTDLEKERKNRISRLTNLRKALAEYRKGLKQNFPSIRKPLPGAEDVYREFGYTPGVDVFIPLEGFPQDVNDAKYREFRNEKAQSLRQVRRTPAIDNLPEDGDTVRNIMLRKWNTLNSL